MNRRNFISLLAGAAGAPLVPWRGLSEPRIFLPPRQAVDVLYELRVRQDWAIRPEAASVLVRVRTTGLLIAEGWDVQRLEVGDWPDSQMDAASDKAAEEFFSKSRGPFYVG